MLASFPVSVVELGQGDLGIRNLPCLEEQGSSTPEGLAAGQVIQGRNWL
ncbi:MAG: hypothetical protein ACFCVD_21055 [Nodosilinea sp.]